MSTSTFRVFCGTAVLLAIASCANSDMAAPSGGGGAAAAGASGTSGSGGLGGTAGAAGTGAGGTADPAGAAGSMGAGGSTGSGGDAGAAGTGAAGAAGTGVAGAAGRGGTGGTGVAGAAGTGGAGAGGRGGAAGAGVAGAGGRGGATGGTTGTAGSTGAGNNTGGNGFYRMERLTRGVVAVTVSGGVYVGWRMFGFEYDAANPANVSYNVYRNGTMIANVTNSTNYLDSGGSASSTYTVRAVIGGTTGADSETATVWAQQYLRIPLMVPAGGTTPSTCPTANEAYTYSANDASTGDVDGDGVYEIILKWDPSNAKDNSQPGCTGNVFIDAYKLNGTRLWRIDLGPNIRAGAHYSQFVVIDADGDGKAEMAVRTAPGSKDASGNYIKMGPAASATHTMIYRNSDGYVLSGPEYLTV